MFEEPLLLASLDSVKTVQNWFLAWYDFVEVWLLIIYVYPSKKVKDRYFTDMSKKKYWTEHLDC